MHFGQRHAEFPRDVQGKRRQNRMALSEEGVERFAEPIDWEFVSGDVPEEFRAGFPCPLGDVDQCHRAEHARGDEDGEGSDVASLDVVVRLVSIPRRRVHLRSMANLHKAS